MFYIGKWVNAQKSEIEMNIEEIKNQRAIKFHGEVFHTDKLLLNIEIKRESWLFEQAVYACIW